MLFVSLSFVSECIPMGAFGNPSPSIHRTECRAISVPFAVANGLGQERHFFRFVHRNTILSFQRTL